jgi:hypothetical protein
MTGHVDNTWHFVASVVDDAALRLYFDGREICSKANGEPLTYTAGTYLWVGRDGNGGMNSDFDGSLDDVRVYNRALSPTEMTALFRGDR